MGERLEDPAQDTKRLQSCINDLVGLLALPAIWRGSEPSQIVETLLDVLLRMLGLEFAYARLNNLYTFDAMPVEILRVAEYCRIKLPLQEIRNIVGDPLAADAMGPLAQAGNRLGVEEISIFPVLLGVQGEIGLIVLGSKRAGFPDKTESLLLGVATNQASIGLQEARILNEQKRIAAELEQRVAERTHALAQTNEELRHSEERWRSVFRNSAIGVAIAELGGPFIATNPVFQKMLGYSEDELQQLTFLDITHEDHVDENRALVDELLNKERQQFQIEKRYRRKDGQIVWARNNVSIMPGTDRTPHYLMTLSEDITQRKLSEEALTKARSELAKMASLTSLGVLTASIAHEVNQPLSGIITNASTCLRMLSADPPNIDGARETVRRTIRDGNRASDVITRLRTLYSKKEPALESMDLNEAAREVTALSSGEIKRYGVTLRQEFSDDLPPALGDRIQLQQVILNLLRNGAEAMSTIDGRPRELLIRTEQHEGNQVRLSVKDSGIGLTPQVAGKIFEAFYTTKTDGMGIGLSVSRSIIEAHQGRLWATPNDGPGSTFSFAIPCAMEASAHGKIRLNPADPSADAA